MSRFRKKPVEVDAFQWDGTVQQAATWPHWFAVALSDDTAYFVNGPGGPRLVIRTLEGAMQAALQDWIIRGVEGEIYACKPRIFAATYEAAA